MRSVGNGKQWPPSSLSPRGEGGAHRRSEGGRVRGRVGEVGISAHDVLFRPTGRNAPSPGASAPTSPRGERYASRHFTWTNSKRLFWPCCSVKKPRAPLRLSLVPSSSFAL